MSSTQADHSFEKNIAAGTGKIRKDTNLHVGQLGRAQGFAGSEEDGGLRCVRLGDDAGYAEIF